MEDEVESRPKPAFLCKMFLINHWRGVASILIPLVFLPLIICLEGKEFRSLYLISVCCFLWITECIPLYVTSMIPMFASPFLGLMDSEKTCMMYFKDTLVMFMAGLMVALAVEYCNLHKRLALKTMLIVGCSPRRLHFGLIIVTTFLSMWISNAATTAMMCPIIKALLEEMEANNVMEIYMDEEKESAVDGKKAPSRPALAFYLAAAYSSSIGGCGTLIGTGTNLVFKGIYDDRFPEATDRIDFPRFMAWALIMTYTQAFVLFFFMQITHMGLFRPKSAIGQQIAAGAAVSKSVKAVISQKYAELGPMSPHEIQVLFWFLLMVALLFTQSPGMFPGWGDVFNLVKIKASCSVVFVVVALFLLPMNCKCLTHFKKEGPYPSTREKALLSWEFVNKNIPWGLIFLLGGGFALASGSEESGMSKMIGRALQVLGAWPPVAVQISAVVFAIILTNFSANVPSANILIPVLCEVAVTIKVHPIFLIFPAGIACSMAFHLPVGTPANAIVSAYANIKPKYMAEGGVLPSICAVIIIVANSNSIHRLVYPNIKLPEWAT